jgi:serine/threonine-protein kinase
MQPPPETLRAALAGRYEVERELGQGGMATVYLARDLKHHRQVAIKVVRPDVAAALGSDRFLREIDTASSLTHPNILPLHDSGEAGGFLYFVMPFVEGESLRSRLEREKQLPLDEALQIAREVADALAYAHGHGIVHRDIKPANILLESGHAVVADFGIARAVSAASGDTLTETGMTLGTPAYMSPEQAAGSKQLDGRSDLYSLGCVLYEMLAGQPPFVGPTTESLVHQHLSVAPRPVTDIRPSVPGWVALALQRALAKVPADRVNAAVFAAALTRPATDSQPIMPAPETPGPSSAPQAAVSSGSRSQSPWVAAVAALLAVAALGGALYVARPLWKPAASPPAAAAHPRSAIAVLPFQNLSSDGANAYFAGGLHDELLTQLSKVAALKVISRTSVMGYQATTKPLTQIADELGVGTIVEGSVQVVGGRLRVNVQLIDAANDQHLWADRYDRTLDDAFAIQSDLAQNIVAAVGAALSSDEQGRLATAPTTNPEAYRLYLQGQEYWKRPGYLRQNMELAQQVYEKALALDPDFALAHAAISQVHGHMNWFRYDPSESRLLAQRREAELALKLSPDLPQAHYAMGIVYYHGHKWQRALQEVEAASRGLPNNAEILGQVGFIHRRLGNWNEVFAVFERAVTLSPRDADLEFDMAGQTHEFVRHYADAARAYDRAVALQPDLHVARLFRGWLTVRSDGRTAALRGVLNEIRDDAAVGELDSVTAQRAALLLMERNAGALLQLSDVTKNTVFDGQDFYLPGSLYAAWAHQLRGDRDAARAAFTSALRRLDAALEELPADWRVHAARGLALAGLGRRADAQREARWLRECEVYRVDALQGRLVAEERARVLAQAGDPDAALDEVDSLLAGPSLLTVSTLRLDPRWDPIRNHPRFQALLKKYGS